MKEEESEKKQKGNDKKCGRGTVWKEQEKRMRDMKANMKSEHPVFMKIRQKNDPILIGQRLTRLT